MGGETDTHGHSQKVQEGTVCVLLRTVISALRIVLKTIINLSRFVFNRREVEGGKEGRKGGREGGVMNAGECGETQ